MFFILFNLLYIASYFISLIFSSLYLILLPYFFLSKKYPIIIIIYIFFSWLNWLVFLLIFYNITSSNNHLNEIFSDKIGLGFRTKSYFIILLLSTYFFFFFFLSEGVITLKFIFILLVLLLIIRLYVISVLKLSNHLLYLFNLFIKKISRLFVKFYFNQFHLYERFLYYWYLINFFIIFFLPVDIKLDLFASIRSFMGIIAVIIIWYTL